MTSLYKDKYMDGNIENIEKKVLTHGQSSAINQKKISLITLYYSFNSRLESITLLSC